MQPAQPHDDNSKLDALVAQYLEALERGEQPDRSQFLQQHPDIATALQEFFADLDKVQAAKEKARPDLAATIIPQHEPKPGAIISGRYKLLENIGEGGMGSVWVAEQQQPVKRRVAIKLVKAGMDSKQLALAQFRLGIYDEALKTLLAGEGLNADDPIELAIIVMAQFRVNRPEDSKKTLEQMQGLLGDASGDLAGGKMRREERGARSELRVAIPAQGAIRSRSLAQAQRRARFALRPHPPRADGE